MALGVRRRCTYGGVAGGTGAACWPTEPTLTEPTPAAREHPRVAAHEGDRVITQSNAPATRRVRSASLPDTIAPRPHPHGARGCDSGGKYHDRRHADRLQPADERRDGEPGGDGAGRARRRGAGLRLPDPDRPRRHPRHARARLSVFGIRRILWRRAGLSARATGRHVVDRGEDRAHPAGAGGDGGAASPGRAGGEDACQHRRVVGRTAGGGRRRRLAAGGVRRRW